MGAVNIDISKKEREFYNLNLSEYNVIMYLVKYRSKIDISYNANINTDFNTSGDIYEFNIELVCLYASLDKLIDRLNLNPYESQFLKLIFEGNRISDIVAMNIGYDGNCHRILDRICKRIVRQNNDDWIKTLKNTLYKK